MPRSLRVRDFMAANLVTFTPEMDVLDAIHALIEQRISGAPVLDSRGDIVGILSEQDCMRVALSAGYHGELGGCVAEFMNRDVHSVDADESIVALAMRFLDAPYRRYPVLDRNRLVGQISRRDVLRALELLR